MASGKNKKELEEENDMLREMLLQYESIGTLSSPNIDSNMADFALGLAIVNDEYCVVKIAYDAETKQSKVIEVKPIERFSKNYSVSVAKFKELQYNAIIKDLKVIR